MHNSMTYILVFLSMGILFLSSDQGRESDLNRGSKLIPWAMGGKVMAKRVASSMGAGD